MSPNEILALECAFEFHRDQIDKQGRPYILHVLRVAFDNIQNCSENVLCAALLHDVVEDCGVLVSDIRNRFGHRVADAVDHLSRREKESYSAYIERLKEDHIAVRVKIADIKDNLSRIESLSLAEQKRLRGRYEKALAKLAAPND